MAIIKIALAAALLMAGAEAATAQLFKGYSKGFVETHENKPGVYRVIRDPTGSAPARRVHEFSISPGCHGPDDCAARSVRSQILENGPHVPAPDGWYGWYQYMPEDFVLAQDQPSGGYYTFAQWKNHGCAHVLLRNMVTDSMLFFETSVTKGDDCGPRVRIPIIDLNKLKGGWHKFEAYAEWSHGDDGRFVLYIDGVKYLDYTGPNQTKGWEHNYFQFGIYLCCTRDTDKVRPSTMYYANVSKSKKRENLK